jgi:hypothetical protein
MTVNIPGEQVGLAAAVVVDKRLPEGGDSLSLRAAVPAFTFSSR